MTTLFYLSITDWFCSKAKRWHTHSFSPIIKGQH